MSTGYLVQSLRHYKSREDPHDPVPSTIVLRDVHPLVWASWPDVLYHEAFFDEILSWQEFPCPDHLWKAIQDGAVLSTDNLKTMIESSEDYEARHDEDPSLVAVREQQTARRHAALIAYRDANPGVPFVPKGKP